VATLRCVRADEDDAAMRCRPTAAIVLCPNGRPFFVRSAIEPPGRRDRGAKRSAVSAARDSSPIEPRASAPKPRTLESVAEEIRRTLHAPSGALLAPLSAVILSAILAAFAHLSRIGTVRARAAAVAFAASTMVGLLLVLLRRRRRLATARHVLLDAAPALGSTLVRRAIEHASLARRIAEQPGHEGVSPALAKLHAERALARLPLEALEPVGVARAQRLAKILVASLVALLAALALAPGRFVEGLDVAFARRGHAPLALEWIDDPALLVRPPSYLHTGELEISGEREFTANRGAELVVRGTPRRAGRQLVLGDGKREVPFVDDGHGGVVARWSVLESARLRVSARFGAVLIDEPSSWTLIALVDESPRVELEGAPKVIDLGAAAARATEAPKAPNGQGDVVEKVDELAEGTLPLRYDAYDDHGLREVHLVLRAGAKTERRVLAKLDGETRHDRGGYALSLRDEFVVAARVPIHVAIAARDNDPIDGPKWGQSAEIILVPPVIGAAEAEQVARLRKLRDALVDALAVQLESPAGEATLRSAREAAAAVTAAVNAPGLPLPNRLSLILRGRARKLREAASAEEKSPSTTSHAATTKAIESLVTHLDEAARALARRHTTKLAKLLAEVAADGAEALESRAKPGSEAGHHELDARIDVDQKALAGGARSLRVLGGLGGDLGELTEAYLRRVARTRADDLVHAALAMRDLEARLRVPISSFGGGHPGQSAGDAGGSGSAGDEDSDEEESEGEKNAGDAQSRLDELAKDHGNAVGGVEDLLRAAEDPKTLEGIEEEAKKRAKALRESVAGLPKVGGLHKGLEAAEASAREKAEAMAELLEKLKMGDARERGESALKQLDDASARAWSSPGAERKLDEAADEVKKQLDWIEGKLRALRSAAASKAAAKVKEKAPVERELSRKAQDLSNESEGSAPLPEGAKELLDEAHQKMDDAAKKLEGGDVEQGLKAQKDAQKLLDQARDQANGRHSESPSSGDRGGKERNPDDHIYVPKAEDHKGPEAFRKRVLEGLGSGQSAERLHDALRRYAEGLIQ
jgi:hypothetical protein